MFDMPYTPAKQLENDFYDPHADFYMVKSSYTPHSSCILKVFKLVINLIVLIFYRVGAQGEFLGVEGTWNLNTEDEPTSEIFASGVFVCFFLYTGLAVLSFCLELRRDVSFNDYDHLPNDNSIVVDLIMNLTGTFMWVAVGGMCLHHWNDYPHERTFGEIEPEKQFGLAVGSLCIVESAAYLVDSLLAFRIHWEQNH